ncbi:hypothetical protein [Pasteurella oralis]|uniref:hypothetical protein n=1 Tax=Pasteurella oralis TaxID=1071947 RepID=UPI000C7C59F4|nr:hypothetical protein [Pasteurella oralis]
MFEFEQNIKGLAKAESVWQLYVNVNKWAHWDKTIRSVSLSGPFKNGTDGVMYMQNKMSIPFTIIECTPNKSFTTKAELGNLCINFVHRLEQKNNDIIIHHKVIIQSEDEQQAKMLGNKFSNDLTESLQNLIHLVNQE